MTTCVICSFSPWLWPKNKKHKSILAFSFPQGVPGCAQFQAEFSVLVTGWRYGTWHCESFRDVGKSLFCFPCKLKTADLLFSLCTLNSEGQVQGAWALELILSDKPLFSVLYGKSFTKKLDTAWDLHLIMFDRLPLAIFINKGCLARKASPALKQAAQASWHLLVVILCCVEEGSCSLEIWSTRLELFGRSGFAFSVFHNINFILIIPLSKSKGTKWKSFIGMWTGRKPHRLLHHPQLHSVTKIIFFIFFSY